MQISRLVPLRQHMSLGSDASFHDWARIGCIIWIDIDDSITASACEDCTDIGNALLAVAFGNKRHIVKAKRLSESFAALVPGCVIWIGQRTDRVDQRRLLFSECAH